MNRTLPRAWIVHEVETLPPLPRPMRIEAVDERTKAVLFPDNKARDFRRTAVIETDEPLPPRQREQTADAPLSADERCAITHYDPQRVTIEADLASPGLLVLSDAWFPGWRAVVTAADRSQETPIYRTNRVLRGVWLPAGKQTVEFRYRPQAFVGGAMISVASWIVLAALGAWFVMPRRGPI
jgi:hypothetical protein